MSFYSLFDVPRVIYDTIVSLGDVQPHARKHMLCNLVPMFASVRSIIQRELNTSHHSIPRAAQFLQNNVKYSQNVENIAPFPPPCGVSILSAGNSSISIEYDEDVDGFGVCARRSSKGTFECFG